ncbi:MAG: hypothetical protein ABIK83_10270 [Candidatus Zixiibacteriota bacterium]
MIRPVHLRMFATLLALALLMGCSSDSGTDTTIKQGNPNDATFLAVRAEVGEVIDELVDNSYEPLTNPWGFPLDSINDWPDYSSLHPDDTIDYNYSDDGWYSLYVGSFATSNVSIVVDSVMFLRNGEAMFNYNSYTDGIEVKRHVNQTYEGEESDYSEQTIHCEGSFSGVNLATATVDALAEFDVDDYSIDGSSTMHINSEYTVTVTDMQFDREHEFAQWDNAAPQGGSISLTVTRTTEVTVDNTTTNTSGDWNITVTFSSNGTASIEVISNNTRWTYSDTFGS